MKKYKLLIITACIPYPLDAGGNISQFAILQVMQMHLEITLCIQIHSDEDIRNIGMLKILLPNLSIISIDLRNKSSFKTQTFGSKIKSFISSVLKSRNKNASVGEYDEYLDSYRISPLVIKQQKLINEISRILNSSDFDIIQSEFHEMLDLVLIMPKKARKIFVSHESRLLRLRTAFPHSKSENAFKEYILKLNSVIEIDLLKRYDAIITFSEQDKKEFISNGINCIYSVPFPILKSELFEKSLFSSPKRFVFVGGEDHVPNKEGIDWFVKNCFKDIYNKYRLPLFIVGKWSKNDYRHYGSNVRFTGFVENLNDVLKDSIMIVPIRIGNGIRAKILYGMAKKIPIISTSIGFEGIDLTDKEEILVANNARDFLNETDFIFNNPSKINEILDNAYNFVCNNFSQNSIVNKRLSVYKDVLVL